MIPQANNKHSLRESPAKINKNSFSSSILNKLGTYLKSSHKLNENRDEDEDAEKQGLSSSIKIHKRSINRRGNENRIKSRSMFVESSLSPNKQLDTELTTFPSPMRQPTNKVRLLKKRFSLKLKKSKKNLASFNNNDSGILTDIFHKGSMSNIRHRLSNATSVLRQSFSVFSLKQTPHVSENNAKKTPDLEKNQVDKDLELYRCKSRTIESCGDDDDANEDVDEDESEMSSNEEKYAEIEEEEVKEKNAQRKDGDVIDFDFNKNEEFPTICSSGNRHFIYNSNPESMLSNNKSNMNIIMPSCLKNGDILKHQHQNKSMHIHNGLERCEIDAPSSNHSTSELKKLDKSRNFTENRKKLLAEKNNNVSNENASKNNKIKSKEISIELEACSIGAEATSKTLKNNNYFERKNFFFLHASNNNQQQNLAIKSNLDYTSPTSSFIQRRSSLISSSSSSGSSSGVTRSSISSSSGENSSDCYSSINQFQSKLNKFRNNFDMSKKSDQQLLAESKQQRFEENKFASLRRTSTFHATLANPFNTLVTPRPSGVPKIAGNEYGSMANLIEER
jgi:hypothetical protein